MRFLVNCCELLSIKMFRGKCGDVESQGLDEHGCVVLLLLMLLLLAVSATYIAPGGGSSTSAQLLWCTMPCEAQGS